MSPCDDHDALLSTTYIDYSIHNVVQILTTKYTEYCIYRVPHHPNIDCPPLPPSHSFLISWWTSLYSTRYIPNSSTDRPNRVSATVRPIFQSTNSRWMAPNNSSDFDWSQPLNTSPNLLIHALLLCTVTVSKCISKLDSLWPSSVS